MLYETLFVDSTVFFPARRRCVLSVVAIRGGHRARLDGEMGKLEQTQLQLLFAELRTGSLAVMNQVVNAWCGPSERHPCIHSNAFVVF